MNKQLSSLFLSNFAIFFVGSVFPLLPVYADQFGATPAMIGMYLALINVAISIGALLPGWLSRRISQKAVFVSAGLCGVLAAIVLGQAAEFWQVVALTGIVWFAGGVGISLVSVFTGRSADKDERGKWFSLIALTTPLGAVIGGSTVSWLVDTQGYAVMFAALGGVFALWPLAGLFLVKYPEISQSAAPQARTAEGVRPGRTFSLLVWTVLLVAVTLSVSRLGLSLSMKASLFSPAAISHANVVGGLITIPFVLGVGLLSDRVGRRPLLALASLLAAFSSLLLLSANEFWHFWLVSGAALVARILSGSVASALATDILAPEALAKALPRLSSMNWVAGVLGFAGSGYVIEIFGADSLYGMSTLLSLGAVGITVLMMRRDEGSAVEPCPPKVDCLAAAVEASGTD